MSDMDGVTENLYLNTKLPWKKCLRPFSFMVRCHVKSQSSCLSSSLLCDESASTLYCKTVHSYVFTSFFLFVFSTPSEVNSNVLKRHHQSRTASKYAYYVVYGRINEFAAVLLLGHLFECLDRSLKQVHHLRVLSNNVIWSCISETLRAPEFTSKPELRDFCRAKNV